MTRITGEKIFFAVLCAFILLFNGNSHAASSSKSTSSAKTTSSTQAASPPTSQTMAAAGSEGPGGSSTITPDLFTGTMSYSIPIEVPVGRNGMAPSLALTYHSTNGNGWVGVGWDLDVGSIERSTKNGINYSGDNYVLRIGGSSIDLVNVNGEYRAKIEGGFLRVKKLNASDGNAYWEVTDKSGTKYTYGKDATSRLDDAADATKIFKWCLIRVEDVNGNFMTFAYFKDQGQIYPDQIDFTGNYVKFWRDDGTRTDAPDTYSTNFRVKTAYRLKTIGVYAGGNLQRAYNLEYDADPNTAGTQTSPNTGRSLLTSVQQFGKDAVLDGNNTVTGGTALPATVMQYSHDGNSFTSSSTWLQLGNGDPSRYRYADFNGDGKADIMYIGTDNLQYAALSTGTAFAPATTWIQLGNGDPSRYSFADFNGDGKADIMYIGTDNLQYVALSTGTAFAPATTWSQLGNGDPSRYRYADFNGDGKADIMYIGTDNLQYVALSTGTAFAPATTWIQLGNGAPSRYSFADFNGDGKADIMYIGTDNLQYVALSTGLAADLCTKIFNGLGGTTTIGYTPSTQYANTQLSFPIQTVSSVTTDDGNSVVSTTTYAYSGGFYHIGEKDFRGFNYVKVTGPVGPSLEQAITETWFHQGDETNVLSENISVGDLITLATVTTGYMKGKPYRSRITDGQGRAYSTATTSYVADDIAPYFNPPEIVDSYGCDGMTICDDTAARHSQTISSYDANGNVLWVKLRPDMNDSSYDSTTIKTYSPVTDLFMGLPTSEATYQGIVDPANPDPAKKLIFKSLYYDGVTDCTTASTNQTPTKGQVTRIVRWFSGGTDPEVRMAYDNYGNLKCSRDDKGNTAVLSYDSSYNTFAISATNPLGHQVQTQYYSGVPGDKGLYGQVKSVTDPNGAVTAMEYDPIGRKTKTTAPDGTWTSWSYNNFGTVGQQHIKIDTAVGLLSWNYFDGLGRTIIAEKTGPDGKTIAVQSKYNPTGTVTQSSLPYFDGEETPRWTSYTYDPMGRTVRVNNPDGTSANSCYFNGVTVVIDAEKHRKRSTTNTLGKLVKVEEYLGTYPNECTSEMGAPYAATNYQYDVLGNLHFVIDAEGNQTEMRYDTLGRKVFMHDPDMSNSATAKDWTYQYDANGNLLSQKDAKDQTIVFTYDQLNRVTKKDYPTGTDVIYTYDETTSTYAKGRLTTMTDASGTTKYFYDNMGRPTQVSRTVSATAYVVSTAYTLGRLTSITYPAPDNTVITYEYDGGGNLKTVKDATTSYATYAGYNALGQPAAITYGNGVTTTYQYEALTNRVQNITTASAAAEFIDLTYSYYPGGNVQSITDEIDAGRSQTFIYDDINRLIQAQSTNYGALFYVYDQIGNITSKEGVNYTYASSRPHAVVSTSDGKSYIYDQNGNMITEKQGTTVSRSITYNYDNMPQSILASSATTTFVYDGGGSRVKKTTSTGDNIYIGKIYECKGTTCTKYIFSGSTRVAMKNSSDTLYYHQDHLGSTLAVTSSKTTPSGTCSNNPVRIAGTTPVYYTTLQAAYNAATTGSVIQVRAVNLTENLTFNRNITVTIDGGYDCNYASFVENTEIVGMGTDSAGTVTTKNIAFVTTAYAKDAELVQYLPFGAIKGDAGSISVNHKFNSQEFDAETGLYNYNARFYNPLLGRFISPDTVVPSFSDPQMLNRYSYVRNNPLLYTDPTGHSLHLRKAFRIALTVISPVWRLSLDVNDSMVRQYTWFRIGESVFASVYGGPAGAAAYAAYTTDLQGGSLEDVAKSAAITGASAYAFQKIDALKAGADSSVAQKIGLAAAKVTLSGVAGGASADLQGGNFSRGFFMSAGSAAAMELYKASLNTEKNCVNCQDRGPKPAPGVGTSLKSGTDNVLDADKNNFGLSLRKGVDPSFLSEGSVTSEAFNLVPGMNATAVLHDIWAPVGCSMGQFLATMPLAGATTYAALLNGTPGVALSVEQSKK